MKHPLFHQFYMMIFMHILDLLSKNWEHKKDEVTIEEIESDDDDDEDDDEEEDDEEEDDRDTKRRRIVGPTCIEGQPVVENTTKYYKDFVIYRTLTRESYAMKLAHASVADKIRARGTPVDANTRIEYIMMSDTNEAYNPNVKQYEISEDLSYFLQFREVLRMDFLMYLDSQ